MSTAKVPADTVSDTASHLISMFEDRFHTLESEYLDLVDQPKNWIDWFFAPSVKEMILQERIYAVRTLTAKARGFKVLAQNSTGEVRLTIQDAEFLFLNYPEHLKDDNHE